MYNLLVAGNASHWDNKDNASFEWSRFLEHTQPEVRKRFDPVTDEVIAELKQYPILICPEFPASAAQHQPESLARVGRIIEIRRRAQEIQVGFALDPLIEPIPTARILELAWDLDINIKGNENYRNHWAVKEIDLIEVLRKHGLAPVPPRPSASSQARPQVFIVHGRDDGVKNDVARWIARIGLEDVVLHEQPNVGRTIITKFQDVASRAAFAIVLMTPDDAGGLAGGVTRARARQNVIFELGYFIGKLGQERVVALITDSTIEKPSDYEGVIYISYDQRGAWKGELAREFGALGIPIDHKRVF
jgi:predicted nucleotide-binding protein